MAEPPESRASVSSPVSEDASVSSSAISEDGSKSSSSGQESSEDESMRFILKLASRMVEATVNQRQVYFLQTANPDLRAFELPLMVTIKSYKLGDVEKPIDVSQLLDYIRLSLKRNEMLRICAHVLSGVETYTREIVDPYTVRDLSNYSESDQDAEVKKEKEMLVDGSLFPYNELKSNCYCIRVLIINPLKVIILLNHHCIVSDTLSVITHARHMVDTTAIGKSFVSNSPAVITVEHQLKNSPSLAAINKNSEEYKVEMEKFKKMMGNARKVLRLSDPQTPFEPKCEVETLAMKEHGTIEKITSDLDIPPLTLIHFALCTVLGTFVGESDFIVGLTTENRKLEELTYIGCYEKTLPLRIDFSRKILLKELVLKFKEDVMTVQYSPLNTIDLVNNIECLKHRPRSSYPFHVVLSSFIRDEMMRLPTKIGDGLVQVEMERIPPMHTHSDLSVEVCREKVKLKDHNLEYYRYDVAYKYSKGCLSPYVIRFLHSEVSKFLVRLANRLSDDAEPEHISSLLPSIVNLSKFHISNISTTLTPLDLPTNVMRPSTDSTNSSEESVADSEYVEVRLDVAIDISRKTDNVLLCLVAYVACYYTNQKRIGIVYIKQGRVFCFYFVKLAGPLHVIERRFEQTVESATPETRLYYTSIKDFNNMMKLIPKERKTTYLVWCLDENEPDELANDCGLYVNCYRRERKPVTLLRFHGREPWFDKQALSTFVEAFETYHETVMSSSRININFEVQEAKYKERKQLATVCDSGLKFTNIKESDLTKTYFQLFEETAKNTKIKDSTAIVYEDEYMTYGYMLKNIQQLSYTIFLKSPGDPRYVGVYMHRSAWLYISMFACFHTGRPCVPIGSRFSREQILELVKDFKIHIIITESTLLDQLDKIDVKVICIDTMTIEWESIHDTAENLQSSMFTAMFVQFTPLSSPNTSDDVALEAVEFSNMNVVHAINNIMSLTTVDESRVTLASTSVLLNAHIIDSLTPLLRGNCIVIVDDLSCFIPDDVTHAFATPDAICCAEFPDSIESLVVGGGTFTGVCQKKTRKFKKVTCIYTSSKCTVFAASTDKYKPSDPYNIGRITSGYGFKVINAYGHSVPTGFPGILHLYGYCVIAGHPKADDELACCTGDLVRFLPDKTFQLLSRKEVNVVPFKEDKVDLVAVENAMYSFPCVESACAFVHKQNTPDAVLVAFVVPDDISIDQLMFHLENSVPSLMVPKVILAVDKLPLDEFGRIHKATLHAIIDRRESIAVGRVAKSVGLLKQICSIFAKIVRVSPEYYRPTHNFFTHGGDSILALTLMFKLNACLDCEININTMLSCPTPQSILDHVMKTIVRRIKVPKYNLELITTGEHPETLSRNVTFFVKLDADCDRIEPRNIFPKPQFDPLVDTVPEIRRMYVAVTSSTPNDFAFKYLDEFDGEQYEEHIIYIPKQQNVMSPIQRYLRCYLSMQYLQMIFSPNCMHDFEFLIDVPPYLIHKEVFQACDYTGISKHLIQCGVHNVTPDIVKAYNENCPDPEIVLVQHAKVQFLTTQNKTDPIDRLGITLKPKDVPVFFVFMDFSGCGYIPSLSCLKKYSMPAISLIRTVDTPFTSFEELAAYYVDIILKEQPQGPYKLVGQLYGASLAYEIAHQLVAKGHQIKVLMMIDDSPVHERRPALFDPSGNPLPQTSLDPAVFFTYLLALRFPFENLVLSPYRSLLDSVVDVVLEKYPWIFLTREQLIKVYMMFYRQLKCLWDYSAQPTMTEIEKCVLIREKVHPFFNSKDFGLSRLVSDPVINTKYPDADSIDMAIQTLKYYS